MADGQNNSNLDSIGYPNGRIEDYTHGANQEPVTEISVSGTTATVTTAAAHGLTTDDVVDIQGSSVSGLDGVHTLLSGSGDTFTFAVASDTASDTSSVDMTEVPTSSLDFVIGRTDGIQDHAGDDAGTVLQSYAFLGLSTIVQEVNGNGTELTYIQQSPDSTPPPPTIDSAGDRYTGLDRFGRVIDQNWIIAPTPTPTPTPTIVQRDQYGYDSDSNVLYDDIIGQGDDADAAASYSQLYHASSTTSGDNSNAYDPLNRETTFLRGTLTKSDNNDNTGAPLDTITNANINTAAGSDQTQTLDAVGNWSSSATGAGTGTPTPTTLTTTDRTNNSQNELTDVGGSDYGFDNNGNMLQVTGGTATGNVTYDAWDRLIDGPDSYALGYLPNQNVAIRACTGGGNATVSFYTTDMQVLQDDVVSSDDVSSVTKSTAPANQYVWGLGYVNQMVARDDSSTDAGLGLSGSGLGLRIYPLQDANWNVRTLTGTGGTVLERIDYDNYGNSTVLSASYSPIDTFLGVDTYNWNYGFQGGRYDTSLGVYTFGGRLYAPAIDRWLTQDGGYWDGSNLYQAFDGNPASLDDPSGCMALAGHYSLATKIPLTWIGIGDIEPQDGYRDPKTGQIKTVYAVGQTTPSAFKLSGVDVVDVFCLKDGKDYWVLGQANFTLTVNIHILHPRLHGSATEGHGWDVTTGGGWREVLYHEYLHVKQAEAAVRALLDATQIDGSGVPTKRGRSPLSPLESTTRLDRGTY